MKLMACALCGVGQGYALDPPAYTYCHQCMYAIHRSLIESNWYIDCPNFVTDKFLFLFGEPQDDGTWGIWRLREGYTNRLHRIYVESA